MMLLRRRIGVTIVLAGCMGLAACSSTGSAPSPESASAAVEPDATVASTDEVPSTVEAPNPTVEPVPTSAPADVITPADEGAADEVPSTVEALRPAGEPQPTSGPEVVGTSAYISRLSMTSQAIEVKWSGSEGVAEYHIHRVPRTSDGDPALEAMTADNRIHVGDDAGRFADQDVDAGAEYWHGIRHVSANGDVTAHGWHKTAAIDDEEPPSVVEVTAVAENGEVLVTWTEPEENYKLHSYRVFRGVDGEPPESIAVTWRLDQMTFIDDDPPTSAEVVYEVVAFDFHWNRSLPGGVTIDLS